MKEHIVYPVKQRLDTMKDMFGQSLEMNDKVLFAEGAQFYIGWVSNMWVTGRVHDHNVDGIEISRERGYKVWRKPEWVIRDPKLVIHNETLLIEEMLE